MATVLLGISVAGYTSAELSFLQRWPQAIQQFTDHVTSMCRVAAVPAVSEIFLQEPGEYLVFLEGLSDEQKERSDPPGVKLELRAAAGERVPMSPAWRRTTYSFVHSGVSVWSFQIAEPGRYQVVVSDPAETTEPHWVFAIGKDMDAQILQLLKAGAWPVAWSAGIAAAVVIAAMTYFKRRSAASATTGGRDRS